MTDKLQKSCKQFLTLEKHFSDIKMLNEELPADKKKKIVDILVRIQKDVAEIERAVKPQSQYTTTFYNQTFTIKLKMILGYCNIIHKFVTKA